MGVNTCLAPVSLNFLIIDLMYMLMRLHYLWPQKLKNHIIPFNLEAIQITMIATKLFQPLSLGFNHILQYIVYGFCHMPLLFPLFDLCSPSRYIIISVFYLLSFDFHSMIFHIHFHLPSSVHTSLHCLLFHIPYSVSMLLCSISIFITSPSVHYSLPCLPNLNNLTFHFLWLYESFSTFSILLWAL